MRELTERYKASIIDGIPEAALVLYCPALHGLGGKLLDRSVYANHGTISGAAWKRLPSGLPCLSFDGDDYVDCGARASLFLGTGDFSIVIWIKMSTSATHRTILSKGRVAANQMWFAYHATTHKIRFWIGGLGHNILFDVVSDDDKWHQLAVVRNGGWGFVFQDSVSVGGANADISDNVDTKRLTIGASDDYGIQGEYFIGSIALPRIYNRALSATEVLRHYTRERRQFGV